MQEAIVEAIAGNVCGAMERGVLVFKGVFYAGIYHYFPQLAFAWLDKD